MARTPRISDTEWELMQVLWQRSPLAVGELLAALQARDPSWHPKTAQTLLTRLVRKRAVGFKRDGRTHRYRPLVSEAECVAVASSSFLERVFGGSLRPLLVHFVERGKLTRKEIQELKDLLDQHG